MTQETVNVLFALQNAIKGDCRYIDFVEAENKVLLNEKVKVFASKLKKAEEEYSGSVSQFGLNSSQSNQAKKLLSEAKLDLDTLSEMSEYNKKYIAYNDLMRRIDDILFSDFKKSNICKECHD